MKTDLVQRLSNIHDDLESDYKLSETMPDKLLHTAKKLEGSKYVQRGLLALSTGIIKKKKQFNRLYHDEQMRLGQLAVLTSGIEHLDKRTAQKYDLENMHKETNVKVETTLKSIEEEKMTEEKYLHMINTQKAKLKSLAIPIAEIKLQIEKASKELHDVTIKYQRDLGKKLEYDRQAAVWDARLKAIKRQRGEGIKEQIQSFKDKQQFLLFIRKEEEASRDLKNRRLEAQRLLALESSLKHLRGNDYIQRASRTSKR